ncbi:MAG: DNA polymerase I [Acidobacteria bacterium]|nr:MAG: DNA polymerase I [Acidobacteriota bacterium]
MKRSSQQVGRTYDQPVATGNADNGSGDLFLIDGNSLAYRAFFALPESIATSDGRPTNAIYGFASMMVKILTDFRPRAVAVAWDAGMSGRDRIYEPYKAQRRSRPDLLKEQWPHLEPLSDAFGFANVRAEGWEADDVIATIVRQARADGIPVMVVTGDRDAYQLVGDGVRVMSTSRGVTETRVYDREGVIERYGVAPELVPDLIGLKGDTSDNIPGVPGIGEKTAAQLLGEFGSLEAVLENVESISGPKRKRNLTEHADDARISKRLATMSTDIDIELDLPALMERGPDLSRLREAAAEFELRQVIQRLEEAWEGEVPERPAEATLATEAAAGTIADLAGGEISFAIAGGRWGGYDGEALIGGELPGRDELVAALAPHPLVGHDFKSMAAGSPPGLLAALAAGSLDLAHDTMIAAYLIDPARRTYELDELGADEGFAVAGTPAGDGQLSLADGEDAGDPAGSARLAWELAGRQRGKLADLGLERLMSEVEMPLIEVLAGIEGVGVKLDTAKLAAISEELAGQADSLQAEIWELAGREFTIGSPQQLGEVLFDELGLSRKRRGKTGYSTDARVLSQIRDEHEIVAKVERWREVTKLTNTYLDALPGLIDPVDGRIHTTFSQVRAATGRLSSTSPNLQNIPIRSDIGRPIRACFVAADGNELVSCDYNQVELRVLAHVSGDESLREIFASGEDVHAATAAGIVGADPDAISPGERSKAKMVNYGIAYGLSAYGLAERLSIPREEAASYIERYFERFDGVKRFIDATIASAREEGCVRTLMGRRRLIPELRSRNPQTRMLGERLAVNTVIQGTAADIIKLAMIASVRALAAGCLESRLILQIHDELLFEGPAAETGAVTDLARREMVGAFPLDPPLAVEIGAGTDWLAAK